MTSRRARTRGSKRDRFTAEPSPALVEALEKVRAQLPRQDPNNPDVIVTHQGVTVDLREPWKFPSGSAR